LKWPSGFKHVTPETAAAAQSVIKAKGYRCDKVDNMRPFIFGRGWTIYCNNFRYEYEIEDVGGRMEIKVK